MANYKVIGADGKECGPVAPEELRKWAAEGRVGPETMAQAEGAGDWVMLGRIPEMAGAFKVPPSPSPTGLPAKPAKTSVMAILSLIFGVLGFFLCITSIPGLILGIIAMVKISKSKGALGGSGLALAGTIVSSVALLLVPIMAAMLLPALAAAKQKAQQINCINNERQLMIAVQVYASQHNNQFPPAATWCDVIDPPIKVFKCPSANAGSRCDYAFNAKLGGMDESKISPDTVVFFESDGGWDANGGPEMLIPAPRHRRVYTVGLADGSARTVTQAELNSLRWDP